MSLIANRLNKLEQRSAIDNTFCRCPDRQPNVVIIKPVLKPELEHEADILAAQTKLCDRCGKPAHERVLSVEGVTSVIYPKSNFTREEFEEWQNRHVVGGPRRTYEEYLQSERSI